MKKITPQAIIFFLGAFGIGISGGIVILAARQIPLATNILTIVAAGAFLFATALTIWLDKPFDLELFKWPEPKPKKQPEPELVPEAAAQPAVAPQPEATPPPQTLPPPARISGGIFPHDVPSEHWDVDYGDSKQTYQGAELPIWILAGWATFILWAIVYLFTGLPTAF